MFNGQVEDSTEGDYFFYPVTGTEHGSQPSLTTCDRELVSVLEVRIEPGDLNPRLLTQQSVTLPTLPRAEIIDRFRLSKNVHINNMSIYYASNALYSETPINVFNNIQKYCILWILLYHHNTVYHTVLIYLGWNSDTITLIIDNLRGFCWL